MIDATCPDNFIRFATVRKNKSLSSINTDLEDNYRHKGLRRKLVDSLRRKGITDENVLKALDAVPRHFFLDSAFADLAYKDQALPIDSEQTISQPYTVAFQTQLLEISKREKVLEIGTGSGYQAAILSEMGARVFTVERQELLFDKSRKLLELMGYQNIRCYLRDGFNGLPEFAPFEKIIATAGATEIPKALMKQLKIGGILVIPVGRNVQHMLRIIRKSELEYIQEDHGEFRFVPFLKGIQ
jgi:protein-L-isoaspartate(D-aspartate) O-methyltransferase